MTQSDQLKLLREQCDKIGQSAVGRMLASADRPNGYSPSAISQVLAGKYAGDASAILNRVEEVFGSSTVQCPVLGTIPLGRCADKRALPFAATNPDRIRLWRACRECERGK